MNSSKEISLGGILQVANIGILIVTHYFFFINGSNDYINANVILAVILIHLQIFYILRYEKKHPNPFLILLSYIVILFYLLRITTLIAVNSPFSLVFSRSGAENINANDIFNFLVYMYFCILAIYIGHIVGFKYNSKFHYPFELLDKDIKDYSKVVLFFGITTLLFVIYTEYFLKYFPINSLLLGILSNTFDYLRVVTLITIIILLIPKNGKWKPLSNYLIFLIILIFFLIIIGGSSGPMLRVGIFFVCSILAVKFCIVIKRKFFIFLTALLIVTTFIGTFVKFNKNIDITQLNEKITDSLSESGIFYLYEQISARAGFLDFSVELINNYDYFEFINFNYYFKSLVDSFTPGFDVYDSPLAANAIRGVYTEAGKLSREDVANAYHSDQINCFAEYYILFGPFLAVVMMGLSAYIFSKIFFYCRFKIRNKIINLLFAATVLTTYYGWLKSFGLDWAIIELLFSIYFIFTFIFVVILFKNLRRGFLYTIKNYKI